MPAITSSAFVPGFPGVFKGIPGIIYASTMYKGILYVAGDFSSVHFSPGSSIPRPAIATIDPLNGNLLGFLPVLPGIDLTTVFSMTILNDVIYVGGNFTVPAPFRQYAAAFDLFGNLLNWAPNPNSPVTVVSTDGVSIFLGGYFTSIGNTPTPRAFAAAVDTVLGNVTAWDPDPDAPIFGMLIDTPGSRVFLGGTFGTINSGGVTRNFAASVDLAGGAALAWNPDPDSDVYDICLIGATAYIGGNFSSINAGGFVIDILAATDAATGAAIIGFNANLSTDQVVVIKERQGNLCVGGTFETAGGQDALRAGIFDATSGALLLAINNGASQGVFDFQFNGNRIFTLGESRPYLGQDKVNNLAKYTPAGVRLPWGEVDKTNGVPTVLAYLNGATYVGGGFTTATGPNGTFPRDRLAAFDVDGNVLPWAPVLPPFSSVNCFFVFGSKLYMGGTFVSVDGNPRSNVAVFDSAGVLLPETFDNNGSTLSIYVDNVFVFTVGSFSVAGGLPRNSLARFSLAGVVDAGYDPNVRLAGFPGSVFSVWANSIMVYIAGVFDDVNLGTSRKGIAILDRFTGLASTPILDTDISDARSIAVRQFGSPFSQHIYMGGNFNSINGTPRKYFAQASTVLLALDADPNLPLQRVKTTVGANPMLMGEFELLNYQSTWDYRAGVATYTPPTGFLTNTGTLTTFAPNVWPIVYDAVVDGVDGNIVFCGDLQWAGTKFAMGIIALDIPAPPPLVTPVVPIINFYLRKDQQTILKWNQVFMDLDFNRIEVDGYRIYRSTNTNLETYELIQEIRTKDVQNVVDTMFTESIPGFYAYQVTAFLGANESEPAEAKASDSPFGSDFI